MKTLRFPSIMMIFLGAAVQAGMYSPGPAIPPLDGMYLPPPTNRPFASYPAQNAVLRELRQYGFTGNVAPPAPGASLTHAFDSIVEVMLSLDGGGVYATYQAMGHARWDLLGVAGMPGVRRVEITLQEFTLSGGTLPPGVLLRESPTLSSHGEVVILDAAGGYIIDSFFDIFTEISLDGGMTWNPALASGRLELQGDPAQRPSIPTPARFLPPPADAYRGAGDVAFSNGVVLRDADLRLFQGFRIPPDGWDADTNDWSTVFGCAVSIDGGGTFTRVLAPAQLNVRIGGSWESEPRMYDLEMQDMLVGGGDLPALFRVRESPTLPSRGGVCIRGTQPPYQISSFFDIFTEISTDEGLSWIPAQQPFRLELGDIALEQPALDTLFPPPEGRLAMGGASPLSFGGILIRGLVLDRLDGADPMPVPGASTLRYMNGMAAGEISLDGGLSYNTFDAPALPGFYMDGTSNAPPVTVISNELIRCDISGGTLPPSVRVRESPTRPSPGCATARRLEDGTYGIDSFFDVYFEMSTDGGLSWTPSESGSVRLGGACDVGEHGHDRGVSRIGLHMPDTGEVDRTTLGGTCHVNVHVSGGGACADHDGNGREEVRCHWREMDLGGTCGSGRVHVGLRPGSLSVGRCEETVNSEPRCLDMPPYRPVGHCDSFFDVYLEIEHRGRILHNVLPARLNGEWGRFPPLPGERLILESAVPLVDEANLSAGVDLVEFTLIATPALEIDVFLSSEMQLQLLTPSGELVPVQLWGTSGHEVEITPEGWAADRDADGRDEAPARMTALSLKGNSPLGPVSAGLSPGFTPVGAHVEQVNNTPGTLDVPPFAPLGNIDSFFDVFFEVTVDGDPLHTEAPLRMSGLLHNKPPLAGGAYVTPPGAGVPLLNEQGLPSGYVMAGATYAPVATPCPVLSGVHHYGAGGRVTHIDVTWTDDGRGCRLWHAPAMDPTAWAPYPGPILLLPDGRSCVTVPVEIGLHYFRMCGGCE